MAERTKYSVVTEEPTLEIRKYAVVIIVAALVVGVATAVVVGIVISLDGNEAKAETNILVVKTDCGPVQGKREKSQNGNEAYVFKGIPYAKPPVGKRRWKPPEDMDRNTENGQCWKGTYKATKFGPVCAQSPTLSESGFLGSEDCLTLNVWTKNLRRNELLPVLVWIHGGGLLHAHSSMVGSGSLVDFVHQVGVVAVSMNHRLNAFGFLALDVLAKFSPTNSSGKYGLMDQIHVLRWVKNNIKGFGGNPNLVTIMGQGEGGKAVHALLASPMASGLIHRAIPKSGPSIYIHTHQQAAKKNAIYIKKANCTRVSDKAIYECLYSLTPRQVVGAIPWFDFPYWSQSDCWDTPTKGRYSAPFYVLDPIVVPISPYDLAESTNTGVKPLPILITTTAQENETPFSDHLTKEKLMLQMNKTLGTFSSTVVRESLNLYKPLYKSDPRPYALAYTTIGTDIRITCPTNFLVKRLAAIKGQRVYQLVVETRPTKPFYFQKGMKYFAFHGWDMLAIFGFKSAGVNNESNVWHTPAKEDLKFRDDMIKEISHFIKYGYPLDKKWLPYPFSVVVHRQGNFTFQRTDYHRNECEFWTLKGLDAYGWVF